MCRERETERERKNSCGGGERGREGQRGRETDTLGREGASRED